MARIKCYISAPASFDLTKIESILTRQNVDYHSFYDFSIGTTFTDLVRRKIRESDFVIAILFEETSNVLFELGIAEGLKKPTFTLINKSLKVPFFLDSKLYYQTTFSDFTLIEIAISNFIVDVKTKRRKSPSKLEKDTLNINDSNDTLIRINQLRQNPSEVEIINLIKDTFSKIDVQNVSMTNQSRDIGVDLVIRSHNLTPYFGNPIFVQTKVGSINREQLYLAQQQLAENLQKTEAKGAIIIYLDRDNNRFENIPGVYPNILLFDFEDFINGIASEGLERLLINTRNKLAHGS